MYGIAWNIAIIKPVMDLGYSYRTLIYGISNC
jgi:hypothetical protein